jgi:hypothetical protein
VLIHPYKNNGKNKHLSRRPNHNTQTLNEKTHSFTMDYVKNLTGGSKNENAPQKTQASGGFMDRVNGALGGGAQSEKKEDGLDKGSASSPALLRL